MGINQCSTIWVKKIIIEIKIFNVSECKSTIYKNLCNGEREVVKRKYKTLNEYIENKGRSKISNQSFHLRKQRNKNNLSKMQAEETIRE